MQWDNSFRPRRMHSIDEASYATDVARSVICVYVCLCVGHTDVPCKNE